MKWIKSDDKMKISVGMIILAIYAFLNICAVFVPGIDENKLVHHLIGVCEGAIMTVVAFYYGSSKSSQDKDKKLREDEKLDN